MAVSLGKRKRVGPKEVHESSPEDEEDMRTRFQRAFEAKFRPLKKTEAPAIQQDESDMEKDDDDESDDSDWDGFSSDDDQVEVVVHAAANGSFPEMDRSQQRAYMSSKPPVSAESVFGVSTRKSKQPDEDDASEAANMKHDLALQRLLKESHLLDPATFSARDSAPEGKGRLKALDLRMQGLGAKSSFSTQDKMPIAHRKGIQSKGVEREQKRRSDARENGVVLEKARHAAKDMKRRDRSVGGPTVGKFRGGTLKLSGKDLRDIQGPKKTFKGKKGRR